MGGPHQTLSIVLHDPFFAWLRPLSSLIVQLDERLAAEQPVQPADFDAFREQTRSLLQKNLDGPGFGEEYRRVLQASPDVVIAHGRVSALLSEDA
jgi:hypothetical protein